MNLPRDREHDLERLLADDAGEFGKLYRRLSRVDPPRRLDRAVLGEAVRAVRGHQPRQSRWIVGVGSAAGIVLAAGIAWQVGREPRQPASSDLRRDAPAQVVPVKPITPPAVRNREQTGERLEEVARPASAPVPPASKPAAKHQATSDMQPSPPSAPVGSSNPVAAEPFPAAAVSTDANVSQAPADAGGSERKDFERKKSDAVMDGMRAGAAAAPAGSLESSSEMALSADAWLQQIRELVRQGKPREASESLQRFVRAYPDRTIPVDLRKALDQEVR